MTLDYFDFWVELMSPCLLYLQFAKMALKKREYHSCSIFIGLGNMAYARMINKLQLSDNVK